MANLTSRLGDRLVLNYQAHLCEVVYFEIVNYEYFSSYTKDVKIQLRPKIVIKSLRRDWGIYTTLPSAILNKVPAFKVEYPQEETARLQLEQKLEKILHAQVLNLTVSISSAYTPDGKDPRFYEISQLYHGFNPRLLKGKPVLKLTDGTII